MAEIEDLKIELARLEAYKAVAEFSLKQMGLSLEVAQEQGWVTKRAEVRQRRRAARKATEEAAKWANHHKNRKRFREERRKAGLPPDDQTLTARELRKRIRRTSYQLLLAASIRKLYREENEAGCVFPGADSTDARGETRIQATAAISVAFRNWAREKVNRFRSRSRNSDTTTTEYGSEDDMPSDGSSVDDVGDDNTNNFASIHAHGNAFRAMYGKYGPAEDVGGNTECANLSPKDVSDKTMKTAWTTLDAAMNETKQSHSDWADAVAEDMLNDFVESKGPARPHTAVFGDKLEGKVGLALEYLQYLKNQRENPTGAKPTGGGSKSGSKRKRNKPAAPCSSTYDPSQWVINTTDADDGAWIREVERLREPEDPIEGIETGFMTWKEQETKFPYLDTHLRVRDVSGSNNSVMFDPKTVDSEVWNPLNRIVAEPKTGKREPLKLGPITTLSLARWTTAAFGIEYPLDPIQLPGGVKTEDKKRPLPSTVLPMPMPVPMPSAVKKVKTGGLFGDITDADGRSVKKKSVGFASPLFSPAAPMKEVPSLFTREATPVASVRYPLKSPTATSLLQSKPETMSSDARLNANVASFSAFSGGKLVPPSPLTPRSRSTMPPPPTPNVALFQATTPVTNAPEKETRPMMKPLFQNPGRRASSLDRPAVFGHVALATNESFEGNNRKRPAEPLVLPVKKRQMTAVNDDKENTAGYSLDIVSPLQTTSLIASTLWISTDDEGNSNSSSSVSGSSLSLEDVDSVMPQTPDSKFGDVGQTAATMEDREDVDAVLPLTPVSKAGDNTGLGQTVTTEVAVVDEDDELEEYPRNKYRYDTGTPKSVRFDLGDGLSESMRDAARRAVSSYDLTS